MCQETLVKMKLGIAGYGFFGQAHELIFKGYHDFTSQQYELYK